ncbi:hypothetical protein WJX73_003901 [Symbiochloris irregularis]|uniref:cellulase n=1 Tax=Symbiochloris irregularis TaxID=706552 RepID=A0AAW1NKW4_9CHLO
MSDDGSPTKPDQLASRLSRLTRRFSRLTSRQNSGADYDVVDFDENAIGSKDAPLLRPSMDSSRATSARLISDSLDRLEEAHEPRASSSSYSNEIGVADDASDKMSHHAYGSEDMEAQLPVSIKGYQSVADNYATHYSADEMNPKLKRKHVPLLEEEPEDEWCAAPFTASATEGHEEQCYDKDEWPRQRFARRTRINVIGMLLMLLYIGALGFYIWVRVTKTLDLGPYTWWGIVVFGVEMLGATTTLLYGLNLLWLPRNEPLPEDEHSPGLTKVQQQYHVRVLVPCYKESLEIVARTVHAAYNAVLPSGCQRTIYLCDDGKDAAKRAWVEQQGPEIVYVSGRTRMPGEQNGKSGNLNNCAQQIYPDDLCIPFTELVCIFDADQVCNADFFLKTLPLFDSGDDVGMVLSPQAFFNVDIGADIFNHGNIQFWEYAQVGYGAIDFISCTGTNFLVRSTALREAGWSPEYTLTEDFALGMELTRRKWRCRYVNQYLAVGEAPVETRNCFQQRSRWCKGHFQIFLNSDKCPLFIEELSLWKRILYSSGVWAYFVGALTTPFFIAVPLVTIWGGVFPIIVNQWAVIGLTAYFVSQHLLLNHVSSRKHIMPLWFATISNNILWWTYVKGFWRAFAGTKLGNTLTFKATLKGSARFAGASFGNVAVPGLTLGAMIASLGFGIAQLIKGGTVVTTLSISLVWILYGLVPPFLLMWYNFVGKGATLRLLCKIGFIVTSLSGVAALVDYNTALTKSYQFYGSQMLGPINGSKLGGTIKNTIPIAFSTAIMAWGFLAFPKGIEKAGISNSSLETLKWGTDYLLKTTLNDTRTSPNSSYTNYNIVYQVGNYTLESLQWGRVEDFTNITHPRPAYSVSTARGAADLVGQIVAALTSTAMVWQQQVPEDTAYPDRLLATAADLYGAGIRNATKFPQNISYSSSFLYPCAAPSANQPFAGAAKTGCPPVDQVFKGSMVGFYNSTSYFDDLAWAAAWLYKATRDPEYLSDAMIWYNEHLDGNENLFDNQYLVNWDNLIWPVNVLLAELTDRKDFHDATQRYLSKWLCSTGGL